MNKKIITKCCEEIRRRLESDSESDVFKTSQKDRIVCYKNQIQIVDPKVYIQQVMTSK